MDVQEFKRCLSASQAGAYSPPMFVLRRSFWFFADVWYEVCPSHSSPASSISHKDLLFELGGCFVYIRKAGKVLVTWYSLHSYYSYITRRYFRYTRDSQKEGKLEKSIALVTVKSNSRPI